MKPTDFQCRYAVTRRGSIRVQGAQQTSPRTLRALSSLVDAVTKNIKQEHLMLATRPKESVVHRQVCEYLHLQYSDAIFNSDGAGNNLSIAQAGQSKILRSRRGYPDIFIAEPRGAYHGLFIELKRDPSGYKLVTGDLRRDRHTQEQAYLLMLLRKRGYCAEFAGGFDEARLLIDKYMQGER